MDITIKIDLTDRTHSLLAALLSGSPVKSSYEQKLEASVPFQTAPQAYASPAPAQIPVQTPPPMAAAPIAPQPSVNPAAYTAPAAMPAAPMAPVAGATAYAMEDLARAASQLMDAGKQQDLLGLLAQFGVQALTQLPRERYGEFATALRQMGARL